MSSRMRRAKLTRVFSPPESESKSCPRMAGGMSRPLATLLRRTSASYPPSISKRERSSSYSESSARSLDTAMSSSSFRIRACIALSRSSAVASTSSTV